MKLGIKGHITRGDEVVKILEMLGGKNHYKSNGNEHDHFYYIGDKSKYISNTYISLHEEYKIFSLENFLEKFPYQVGDKVNVWVTKDCSGCADIQTSEITSMRWNSARNEVAYKLKDMIGEFYNNDIGKVNDEEEQQIDPTIDYNEIISKSMNEDVAKRSKVIDMDLLFKAGITCDFLEKHGFTLPDGHHFADENGNVIDIKKIQLVKNSPKYPKNYKECCDVLNIPNDERYIDIDIPVGYNKLLSAFTELLIFRDAYWKISGEQMGLGKPWKPDWNTNELKYIIYYENDRLWFNDEISRNTILAFPTEEMRDAFYENFKNLIEQCKELL